MSLTFQMDQMAPRRTHYQILYRRLYLKNNATDHVIWHQQSPMLANTHATRNMTALREKNSSPKSSTGRVTISLSKISSHSPRFQLKISKKYCMHALMYSFQIFDLPFISSNDFEQSYLQVSFFFSKHLLFLHCLAKSYELI